MRNDLLPGREAAPAGSPAAAGGRLRRLCGRRGAARPLSIEASAARSGTLRWRHSPPGGRGGAPIMKTRNPAPTFTDIEGVKRPFGAGGRCGAGDIARDAAREAGESP